MIVETPAVASSARHALAFELIAEFRRDHDDFMLHKQFLSKEATRWVWWKFEADNYAVMTRRTVRALRRHIEAAGTLILTYD